MSSLDSIFMRHWLQGSPWCRFFCYFVIWAAAHGFLALIFKMLRHCCMVIIVSGISNFTIQSAFCLTHWDRDKILQTDNILKCIFLNENVLITINISLKFVPKVRINNIPALVQMMAWRRWGAKPLSEPMVVRLPMHICIIRPQWVNHTFSPDNKEKINAHGWYSMLWSHQCPVSI